MKLSKTAAAALCAMLATSAARADVAPSAEELFREGREAMHRHDLAAACAKFEESQRLDPSAGTRLNLALCEEERGRIATAWAHYRAVVDEVGESDARAPFARDRAAALASRVPHLRVDVAGAAPPSLVLRVDGAALPALGSALPVDPGEHVVSAEDHGAALRHIVVTLNEGETRTEVLSFETIAPAAPAAARAVMATPPAPASDPRRPLGWALVGVGSAAVLGSRVLGGVTVERQHTMDAHCTNLGCDPTGMAAAADGATFERWATVSAVTGALMVGTGVVLLVTGAKAAPTATALFPLGGRF